MLPVGLTAKAIQLCAAGFAAAASPAPSPFAIHVRGGAALVRQPGNEADAEASVRDLLTQGADFDAGPLAINGRDFASYGVTPASVFAPCALAHVDEDTLPAPIAGASTISSVTALLRRTFGARITDTVRPMNASYGAVHSWHKVGQAVDFVPSAGVMSINRDEIRALMMVNGIRVLELLGPGDRGHANHWHIAFARPEQVIDRDQPIQSVEDWIVTAADEGGGSASMSFPTEASLAPASVQSAGKAPPQWDVFAANDWRSAHGGGS